MLELLEVFAQITFYICVAAFTFSFGLRLLDIAAKVIFYIITKIFIDRSVQYATFSTHWDDAKRRV